MPHAHAAVTGKDMTGFVENTFVEIEWWRLENSLNALWECAWRDQQRGSTFAEHYWRQTADQFRAIHLLFYVCHEDIAALALWLSDSANAMADALSHTAHPARACHDEPAFLRKQAD